jgi:hypothetical protein
VANLEDILRAPDQIYFKEFAIKPPGTAHVFAREDILDAEDLTEQQELTEAVTELRQSLHEEIMALFLQLTQTIQLQGHERNGESHPDRGLYVGEDERDEEHAHGT